MVSIIRIFRLGIRAFEWAQPHVKEWQRRRNLNLSEAKRHLDSKNWGEAEQCLLAALAERRRSAKQTIELMLDLSKAQRRQNKLADAEQTANGAIEVAAKSRMHDLHMRALDEFVEIQIAQGNYAQARQTTEEMVRLERSQSRPDHARLAQCSRRLGTALLNSGQKQQAMQAFDESAKLAEQAFGAEHPETAASLVELGMLHRENGDHASAQQALKRALHIRRAALGADAHEATEALYQLAASLEESGDLDAAANEYERMLALRERQVGAKREQTADVQIRLARLYVRAGKTSAARQLLLNAMPSIESMGGQALADAAEILAEAEEKAGRMEEAHHWREKFAQINAGV